MATYSFERWLISMIDMPVPCQSSSSARACSRTASGSAAGPAQKLKARVMESFYSGWLGFGAAPPAFQGLGAQVSRRGAAPMGLFRFAFGFVVAVVAFQLRNALDTHQLFIAGQLDQGDVLGVATEQTDFIDTGTYQRALVGDQHDVFTTKHLGGPHQHTVALVHHHADHTLGATALGRELVNAGALAVTLHGRRQQLTAQLRHDQG